MAEALVCRRVFTHSACNRCGDALRLASELSRGRSDLELRQVDLTQADGMREAPSEKIRVLPTLIVSCAGDEIRRFEGAPGDGALEAALDEIRQGA